jgi:hypothetical protein
MAIFVGEGYAHWKGAIMAADRFNLLVNVLSK